MAYICPDCKCYTVTAPITEGIYSIAYAECFNSEGVWIKTYVDDDPILPGQTFYICAIEDSIVAPLGSVVTLTGASCNITTPCSIPEAFCYQVSLTSGTSATISYITPEDNLGDLNMTQTATVEFGGVSTVCARTGSIVKTAGDGVISIGPAGLPCTLTSVCNATCQCVTLTNDEIDGYDVVYSYIGCDGIPVDDAILTQLEGSISFCMLDGSFSVQDMASLYTLTIHGDCATSPECVFPPLESKLLVNALSPLNQLNVWDICVDYNEDVTSEDYNTFGDDSWQIASNLNKVWSIPVDGDILTEFDITFSPFSGLTNSGRYWNNPSSTDFMFGISAKGDSDINTLVCNLNNLSIVDLDLTTPTFGPLAYTTKVPPNGRNFINSPIYVPSNNSVISLTTDSTNAYLSQYKYDGGGSVIADIDITAYVPLVELQNCSIFSTTCSGVCAVYIFNAAETNVWKVDTTTQVVSDSAFTLPSNATSISQLPSVVCNFELPL